MANKAVRKLFGDTLEEMEKSMDNTLKAAQELLEFLETDPEERRNERTQQSSQFFIDRPLKGLFTVNFFDIKRDPARFRNYYHMEPTTFDYLLNGIEKRITKSGPRAISAQQRLWLTIRYICHGGSFVSHEEQTRVHNRTISNIVIETLLAIWDAFSEVHMRFPTADEITSSAKQYYLDTSFPNCWAALDGKHFEIRNPADAYNAYRCFKGYYSVNVQALVDSKFRFMAIEAAGYGKESDGGMFAKSALQKLLERCTSVLPEPMRLPGTSKVAPVVMLADKAYPLRRYLMKPFVGKWSDLSHDKHLFNARLASARRTVECAFGQLVAQFHVFRSPLDMEEWKIDIVIMCCFLLHNILIDVEDRSFRLVSEEVQQRVAEKYACIDALYDLCGSRDDEPAPATNNSVRQLFCDFFAEQEQINNIL